jgi:autotransporter passenger strand-loop-strand repeat protein
LGQATTVSAGREFDFGVASKTTIKSGGREFVESGGRSTAAVVSSGGFEVVVSGGATATPTIDSGTLTISSGAAVTGGMIINGGRAILSGTMAAGQTVNFAGSAGVLELDNLPGFGAKIAGLSVSAEKIDLGGFTFSVSETASWAQAGTSGTLKVVDGAKTASLTLIGSYVTSDFHLLDDGHGGTLVFDPPSTTHAAVAARLAEQAAALGDRRRGPGQASIMAGGASLAHPAPAVTAATSGG